MKLPSSGVLRLSAYTLALLAGNVAVLHAVVNHAVGNATASHILIIPFVTLALLYQDRGTIFLPSRPARFLGGVVIVLGFALMVAARLAGGADMAGDFLSLAVAGLLVAWVGGFLLLFGRDATRRAQFPLLFLVFAIPIPDVLLAWATLLLKTGSTEVVAGLFTVTGTPYYRDGFVFTIPHFVIEIADECSGIRSSIALLLTSLLAGRVFLSGPWARALLVAAAVPITVLKNGIRIVSLCLLSIHVDPGFLTGQLHHEGGIFFFMLSLAMLAPIMTALSRSRTLNRQRRVL